MPWLSFLGLRQNKQTFNPTDTNALVAAVAFGKGLSNWRSPGTSGPGQAGQSGAGTLLTGASGMQQVQMTGASSQQQSTLLSGVQMAQAGQPGKGNGEQMHGGRKVQRLHGGWPSGVQDARKTWL